MLGSRVPGWTEASPECEALGGTVVKTHAQSGVHGGDTHVRCDRTEAVTAFDRAMY